MIDFPGKYGDWALIAGASEGLGAAFARNLAGRGMNLVLLARREDRLNSLASELKEVYRVTIECQTVDLADLPAVQQLLNSLNKSIGLLVYNAAFSPIGYFADLKTDDLLKIIDVNVRAPLLMSSYLGASMIDHKRGGIVLVSSLAGQQGSPKIATYAATKAFNTILAEGLWQELESYNIDVIATVAGAIRTPGYSRASKQKEAPGTLEAAEVAEQTLMALGKTPVVIPGIFNKIATALMGKVLGRKQRIKIMFSNTKDLE